MSDLLTDTEVLDALGSWIIMGSDGEGAEWAGTAHWLIKQPPPLSDTRRREAIAGLVAKVAGDHDHDLTEETVDGFCAIARGRDLPDLFRVWRRPDGQRVYLNDAYVRAVETSLMGEDEEGYDQAPTLGFAQGESALAPVCVMIQGEVVALVMPARPPVREAN